MREDGRPNSARPANGIRSRLTQFSSSSKAREISRPVSSDPLVLSEPGAWCGIRRQSRGQLTARVLAARTRQAVSLQSANSLQSDPVRVTYAASVPGDRDPILGVQLRAHPRRTGRR